MHDVASKNFRLMTGNKRGKSKSEFGERGNFKSGKTRIVR
jgi:hypothetical protein